MTINKSICICVKIIKNTENSMIFIPPSLPYTVYLKNKLYEHILILKLYYTKQIRIDSKKTKVNQSAGQFKYSNILAWYLIMLGALALQGFNACLIVRFVVCCIFYLYHVKSNHFHSYSENFYTFHQMILIDD